MKNIILLDVAAIRTICPSLKIFCDLNKNIKVLTTFNFRKDKEKTTLKPVILT